MVKKKYNVLDLFCGCGGLSLGFENAGFNVLLGIDMWEDALVTYRRNHKNSNTLFYVANQIIGSFFSIV